MCVEIQITFRGSDYAHPRLFTFVTHRTIWFGFNFSLHCPDPLYKEGQVSLSSLEEREGETPITFAHVLEAAPPALQTMFRHVSTLFVPRWTITAQALMKCNQTHLQDSYAAVQILEQKKLYFLLFSIEQNLDGLPLMWQKPVAGCRC